MGRRLDLHQEFVDFLAIDDNKPHVYFQPPESIRLNYPCIIYHLTSGQRFRADNTLYGYVRSYDVTIIDFDPDVEYDRTFMERFQYATFERAYAADNLNHWVFRIYY